MPSLKSRPPESFGALMERSGCLPVLPEEWPRVVAFQAFQESETGRSLEARLEVFGALVDAGAGVGHEELARLYDLVVQYWTAASGHAALFGYALGRTEGLGLTEGARIAAARAFAERTA